MEPEKKKEIIDDLIAFSQAEDFYARIGRAWKRGYLLYGPPGTGKSTMIAAMANLLNYDIYDLELTAVKDNTELRRLLIETSSKSIIVIEDIDCSLELTGQRKKEKKKEKKEDQDQEGKDQNKEKPSKEDRDGKGSQVTLSGLLNFIDGLWSACGGERLIVFTTNYKEKLDPALIRKGRMDKHIQLSYCGFEAFKVLAKNYLLVEEHYLFPTISNLLGETKITPADVAEHLMPKTIFGDAEISLKSLVQGLENAKEEEKKKAEEEEAAKKKELLDKEKAEEEDSEGESKGEAIDAEVKEIQQKFNDVSGDTEVKPEQTTEASSRLDKREPRKTRPEKQIDRTVIPDARVRHLKDQLVKARVYLSLPSTRNNPHFTRELRVRMKEVQRAVGDASKDSELPRNAYDRLKAMEQTLAKGKQIQDDCAAAVKKLRAMLHSTEEQLRVHKKQTLFLTQLTAKTLPKGLHCLPLRLTTEYYSLNSSEQHFPNQDKLEDPQLYHYALFSDNVLAAAVVVNSTITHAKDPSKHVFHIVTDRLNYAAMRMWFLVNPPGKATIQVQNIEEFTWLNSSYSPVLKQLGSQSMINYYFRTHRASSDSNLKFRNPKYLSILNHLRFYLPQIFPKLDKVLFVDDDIVVQKDLTALWSLDLKGNVNGAVETCGESFHRFDRYLNFSNPLISKNFDPRACGWAYGMNIFDLKEWKRQQITDVYHSWQKLNHDRQLWKLGTLPPGLITFWKRTYSLDRSWHVLGLGYNPSVGQRDIERAAVIHYNGNMKPWLEIGIPKYRNYWAKYVDYDQLYLRECNLNP